MEGYWEWFRKDGTRMRSGHFKNGKQSGIWTTYDKAGAPFKETSFDKKEKAGFPLYLARPAQRALAGAKVAKLSDLGKMTEAELKALHGMGPSSLLSIRKDMRSHGISFKKAK